MKFKYTSHVILWGILSIKGKDFIDAYEEYKSAYVAIQKVKESTLLFMGYKVLPKTCCFACDYSNEFSGETCSHCPFDIVNCEVAVMEPLSNAIREKDIDKIKQVCLSVARLKMRENIDWEVNL